MPHKFSVDNISRRKVDGVVDGALITIRCDKTDAGAVVLADSFFTWYAHRSDFASWPPTRAQARAYIVAYLTTAQPGGVSRAQKMRDEAVVVEETPEVWSAAEKDLTVP